MARCIWVSRFNGLYHQLEELSIDSLDLKVHLVHVTDKKQRQDKHCAAYYLQPSEKEREHDWKRTRNKIIQDRVSGDSPPCFTNGNVGRGCDSERHRSLVHDKEHKNHRCKGGEVYMNSIEPDVTSQSSVY